MPASNPLIIELEKAVQGDSLDKRIATMKRVTSLFLTSAQHLNDQQMGVFDSVLLHLIKRVENKALAELSISLAPASNAPLGVVQHLARHDDILVAGPILSQSERLSASDLIEIAGKKGQAHLLAISDRVRLVEAVTDILLKRGNNSVFCKLAKNSGAAFSKAGFEFLIDRAKSDETLAETVGQRIDVPRHLLHDLVKKATDAVRKRLLATAPAQLHAEINGALAIISRDVIREVGAENRSSESAQEFVFNLQRRNQLKEPVIADFASKCELEKLTAALALTTSTQFELVDRLMRAIHFGGMLVVCKAAELKWSTVETILVHRHPNHPISFQDLDQAKADFAGLTRPTANRLLGFWQARPEDSPT